jgi:hypothetical protein
MISQTKRCSVTDINGVVTVDNSGGGECEAGVNGVNVSSGTGTVVNAGAINGGDLPDAFKNAFGAPIVCHSFYPHHCSKPTHN